MIHVKFLKHFKAGKALQIEVAVFANQFKLMQESQWAAVRESRRTALTFCDR